MHAQTLIIGCGYIGLPLAHALRRKGHRVTGWVHSASSAATLAGDPFAEIIIGNVADEKTWSGVRKKFDLVIHCASSGRGGEAAYEEVFHKGALLIGAHQPLAAKIFVSSTSVYGQAEGEVVTEESPAQPVAATGRILRQAEQAALATGARVVRSAGIYGPARCMLFERFRRGEAILEGDGLRWINQVHQRDLVAALVHLAGAGAPGEIYNASDDAPVTQRDYYAWCSEFLHLPLPPYGPVNTQRKRGLTNKRVSNAKLRATGWEPVYPSFREGIASDFHAGDPPS